MAILIMANTTIAASNIITPKSNDGPDSVLPEGLWVGLLGTVSVGAGGLGTDALGEGLDEEPPSPPLPPEPEPPSPPDVTGAQLAERETSRAGIVKVTVALFDKDTPPTTTVQLEKV